MQIPERGKKATPKNPPSIPPSPLSSVHITQTYSPIYARPVLSGFSPVPFLLSCAAGNFVGRRGKRRKTSSTEFEIKKGPCSSSLFLPPLFPSYVEQGKRAVSWQAQCLECPAFKCSLASHPLRMQSSGMKKRTRIQCSETKKFGREKNPGWVSFY